MNPPSPLLNILSALALSAFTAATTFKSMALASSAVPYWPRCCANAVDESANALYISSSLPRRAPLGSFRKLRSPIGREAASPDNTLTARAFGRFVFE
jgi:hypothetical protein